MAHPVVIEEAVVIRRPPEVVWAFVLDYSADHRWRPGITEMTLDPPAPPAVGTSVREVVERTMRKNLRADLEQLRMILESES